MWKECVAAIVVVFVAHALTYFLVNVLPDAAVVALGLEGTHHEVLAAFHAQHVERSYVEVIQDLVRFDFGKTLDGTQVSQELAQGIMASAPRVFAAFFVVVGSALSAALLPIRSLTRVERLAPFLAFLPPYLLPFLGAVALLSATFFGAYQVHDAVKEGVAVLALALAPAALAFVQVRNITRRNLASDFARILLASGATPFYQRWRLVNNAVVEISPTLEKIFTTLVAILLFLEPIFGTSGFGTTAVRAIKRSDVDLILGVTFLIALCVCFCRIVTIFVRRKYGTVL